MAISLVVYPVFVLIAAQFAIYHSYKYFQLASNQSKLANILGNAEQLEQYGVDLLKDSTRKIEKIKAQVKESFERYLPENCRELKIERVQEYFELPIRSSPSNSLPTDYWQNFDVVAYLSKDFIELKKKARSNDDDQFLKLYTFQTKYRDLLHQQDSLSNVGANEKLEMVRKIAELAFVKVGIRKQNTWEWVKRDLVWMLPTGIFWRSALIPFNDRLVYEGKKEHLVNLPGQHNYADLVDAHNQLITCKDYLIPYRGKIVKKSWPVAISVPK